MNFCPGELFLKLLARIGEWHQNLSEKTVCCIFQTNPTQNLRILLQFERIFSAIIITFHNKDKASINRQKSRIKITNTSPFNVNGIIAVSSFSATSYLNQTNDDLVPFVQVKRKV